MSTSTTPFTYPQIEGTLLERVRHNLRLHDQEYNHLSPPALFAELDAAIEAPWSAVRAQILAVPFGLARDSFLHALGICFHCGADRLDERGERTTCYCMADG